MKKTTLMSLLGTTLLAGGAFADAHMDPGCQPQPQPVSNPCCFSGMYVGAAIGYGSHKARTEQVLTLNSVVAARHKNDLSLDGINGGVFLGYGKEFGCSRVYLGLELGYFFDGAKGKYTFTPTTRAGGQLLRTEVKRKDGLELAARMGWIFNQTLPYIKLGWANTKVEATQVVVDNVTTANDLTQKFLSKRVNGFLVGAGIDMKLNRCWIAGLEYTYSAYQKKTGPRQEVAAGVVDAADNWTSSVRLSDNKFRLRLAYQF